MKIKYWSDIACPYCYLGKARLNKALKALKITDPTIELKSFPLASRTPKDFEQSFLDHLTNNHQELEKRAVKEMNCIEKLAQHEGLAINIFAAKFVNTLDAHRLIKAAQVQDRNLANQFIDKLYQSFFVKGDNLAQETTLINIWDQAGLARKAAEKVLHSELFLKEVNEEKAEARKLQVQALPFFVIDDQYTISGMKTVSYLTKELVQISKMNNLQKSSSNA